ncbi:hypothetical protein G3T14_02840 [Methylobacterium sp. BTF04]|uniref:hypothetical protein n=1 Tax=Methylobacterium sp. BTF04 TaxID=2708300 RepID=UPI0013D3D89A|nr:hypothetical protein [Methylobacterium sp. BTF04]NEU11068.1 hypothetical protein [Methylobacterium sp. BTF04]
MSDPLFAFFDIGLVFALAIGLALWQLLVLKRSIRRDRQMADLQADIRDTRERRPNAETPSQ